MIAIVETSTGNVRSVVYSTNGVDMTGCHTKETPPDYDPVAVSHVLIDGEWDVNLAPRRSALVAAVNDRAEAIRAAYLTPGTGQAMTYVRKEDEARRFDPGGDPADYPFLWAEAESTGATLADTAALVLAQADAWVTIGAAIEGNRRGLVVAIEAAADLATLEALDIGAGWPA